MLLPYVAGLFDGEGCVHLRPTGATGISPRVKVALTSSDIISSLYGEFGGHTYQPPKLDNRKQVYIWQVNGKEAIDFLRLIFDHLIIKKAIAELAISAYVVQDREGMTTQMQKGILESAHRLNH